MTEKQPIGPIVNPLPPRRTPEKTVIGGRYLQLERLSPALHETQLFNSFDQRQDTLWTYMAYGPFTDRAEFSQWLATRTALADAWFYAYVNLATSEAQGMGSFMRADPPNGVIEIGNIWFSPQLQKTREATEAIYLMMRHSFEDLGVRRLEWKCDALNAPSRAAAARFGFTFEGIFRQHMIIKGRNRDTAWFAVLDNEWPDIGAAFAKWLSPDNFDDKGVQKAKLQVR